MSRSNQALIVLTLVVMGIWGCAENGQAPGASLADRIKALEAKNAKLEDDFRAVAATRDQLRRKLAVAEEEQARLQKQVEEQARLQKQAEEQLQTATREHDELRGQLTERTKERDALVKQFEQFRKTLKDLIGQAEAALPHPAEPVTKADDSDDPERS